MKKKISIIIVTYNSELHIYDCLDSIFKYNDIGDDLEIIIVDNMSNNVDQMFTSIKEKYASTVKLVKNHINGGYGQGNNVGIRLAKSDIIMIMNPDVRLLQPVFNTAINSFEGKKIVLLGMQQMISHNKRGLSFNTSSFNQCGMFSIFEAIIMNKLNCYNQKRMYISGSCFFIDKPIFNEIGLFNESIFMYGEENDLHYRLKKLKPKMISFYNSKISYLHLTDNRPLDIGNKIQILNSILYLCSIHGFNQHKVIRYEIFNAFLFRVLERLKGNKDRSDFYSEWISILNLPDKKIAVKF